MDEGMRIIVLGAVWEEKKKERGLKNFWRRRVLSTHTHICLHGLIPITSTVGHGHIYFFCKQ